MNVMLHHNQPPTSEVLKDNLSDLGDMIERETAALVARRDEFLANCEAIPTVIDSDDLDGRVNDQIAQWTKYIKEVDRWKDDTKAPVLTADRLIMATRARLVDPIERIKKQVNDRSTLYKRAKMERERQARESAAAEAARIAAEAEKAAHDTLSLQTAIDAAAEAEVAHKATEANAADLSRSRGDWGSVSSLQTFWDFADLDRNAIDLEALRPHLALDAIEKAIRAAIRSGARKMRGVRIFENTRNSGRG